MWRTPYGVEVWIDEAWVEVCDCHTAGLALELVEEYRAEGHAARFVRRAIDPPEVTASDGNQREEQRDG
jgi:hypothetical protein